MTVKRSDRFTAFVEAFPKWAGALALAVGLLALVGWQFNLEFFKRLTPRMVAINPATAVCFMLCGVSVCLFQTNGSLARGRTQIAQVCAFAVVVIALLRLAETCLGLNFQVDQFLFRDELAKDALLLGGRLSGRMAPGTALNFLSGGLALLLLQTRSPRNWRLAQGFALLVVFVSWLALLGYSDNSGRLFVLGSLQPMALSTAVTFLVLALGIGFLRPNCGLMSDFTSPGTGGIMARRLLPTAILAPTLLGAMRPLGEKAAFYGPDFGASLLVVSNIFVFGVLIWRAAGSLNLIELEREGAQAEIQKLNEALEQRVANRTAELRQSEAQVRELNAELEQRVFERTTALAATNKRLQHDITERKRVERALRESEGRFRSLAASSPIGIFQTDLEGRCLYTNEEWQRIADFTLEESLGEGWVKSIHPEDRELVLKLWADCTGARTEFSREFRVLTPQGDIRWVHSYAAAIVSHGEVTGYVGTTEDITEWKMAEERFRVLFEFSSNAHLLMDEDGIVDCNHAAVSLLNCQTKSDLLAMRPGGLSPGAQPDGRESVEKYLEMERRARERGYHRFEWTFRKTSGEEFPAEVGLTPVTINNRPSLLAVLHDLTERKQAEEKLRRFAERLELNNHELKEALAKVKTLRGLLPICSGCKKIRDDKGYWNQIEFFIRDHSDANFSHGMCPECTQEYFPGLQGSLAQKA